MIDKRIGERIKQCRERLGLTQDQFAERLGLTTNYISTVERGASFPGWLSALICMPPKLFLI